jgi:hypothetical protein
MQGVDDRITARAILVIARGQEDERVAVDGVALQIALERLPVNLDALDDGRTRTADRIGHVRLHLRHNGNGTCRCCQNGRQHGRASF